MKYKTFKSLVLLFMLSAMASMVNAALIDNGITTIDDVTGLEWLDITETTGLTYNQVLSSTYVVNDGYRFATEAEIMGLYAAAGGTGTQPAIRTVENKAPSILLLGLMGCTSPLAGVPCDGVPEDWTPAMWGASAQFIGLIDDVEATKGILSTRWLTHSDPNSSRRADIGAFLVRNGAPSTTYTVGGTVSGLTGSVTLQNNGGDDIIKTTNDGFTFTAQAEGTNYAVTVSSQPSGQTCSVTGGGNNDGSGTNITANVTNVTVTCVDDVVIIDNGGGPATPVPTMSVWGLGILIALMGLLGFNRRRKM